VPKVPVLDRESKFYKVDIGIMGDDTSNAAVVPAIMTENDNLSCGSCLKIDIESAQIALEILRPL
jgi:hypothetical protein